MALVIFGLNKYIRKTEKQKERIKVGAAEFTRRKVRAVLRDLVLNTPQWSGNTAASWKIELNYLDTDYTQSSLYLGSDDDAWRNIINSPKFKGDKEAWTVALAANIKALEAIRYNSQIRIVNVGVYAGELATAPERELKLRSGNYIQGDVMAVKTVTFKHKVFSNITAIT